MKLLVVIVTYNAMKWVERCFESLRNSSVVPDVFVVDNGSTDGTQQYLKNHYPEVIFQQSKENLGFGKANNIGMQYALDYNYSYVYLLNQDAWVMPDTFKSLIEVSMRNPLYGILSPFQMNADMAHIDRNFLSVTLRWKSNHDIVSDLYSRQITEVYSVESVMAAHWFMTRDCLLKVGGFSPSFPHYAEDDNYIDRVHFRGLKVGVVPSLMVVHDRGGRCDSQSKKIYKKYTSSIRILSNPFNGIFEALIHVLFYNVKWAVKLKSFAPLLRMLTLFLKSYSLFKNKRIAIETNCAFLNEPLTAPV